MSFPFYTKQPNHKAVWVWVSLRFCIVLPYPFPGSPFLWNYYITVGSSHFNKMEFPKERFSIIRKFQITSAIIPQEISSWSTTEWDFLYIYERQVYLLGTSKGISQRRMEESPKVLQLLTVVLGLVKTFIQIDVFKKFTDRLFLLPRYCTWVIQSGKTIYYNTNNILLWSP